MNICRGVGCWVEGGGWWGVGGGRVTGVGKVVLKIE